MRVKLWDFVIPAEATVTSNLRNEVAKAVDNGTLTELAAAAGLAAGLLEIVGALEKEIVGLTGRPLDVE